MYQVRDYEAVNMILRNPTLWDEGMITETLRRFKRSNSHSAREFNAVALQEIIKTYFLTLSDKMKNEDSAAKDRENEEALRDVNPLFVSGI